MKDQLQLQNKLSLCLQCFPIRIPNSADQLVALISCDILCNDPSIESHVVRNEIDIHQHCMASTGCKLISVIEGLQRHRHTREVRSELFLSAFHRRMMAKCTGRVDRFCESNESMNLESMSLSLSQIHFTL